MNSISALARIAFTFVVLYVIILVIVVENSIVSDCVSSSWRAWIYIGNTLVNGTLGAVGLWLIWADLEDK
jgi:succinate dehydrogenase hydrophobic anchor subunit